MVVNGPKGGKKQRRGGRKRIDPSCDVENDTEVYAVVKGKIGDTHISVVTLDGQELNPRIPGKFWKKIWFKTGNYVVVIRGDGNIDEIKGMVIENKIKNVKREFEKMGSENKGIKALISFIEKKEKEEQEENESSEDELSKIPQQPNRDFDLKDRQDDSDSFDFDKI